MSISVNLHYITSIEVAEFPDDDKPFARIRLEDEHGCSVTIFPGDVAGFIAALQSAADNRRIVRNEEA